MPVVTTGRPMRGSRFLAFTSSPGNGYQER
jgi:hypothetical protein